MQTRRPKKRRFLRSRDKDMKKDKGAKKAGKRRDQFFPPPLLSISATCLGEKNDSRVSAQQIKQHLQKRSEESETAGEPAFGRKVRREDSLGVKPKRLRQSKT